MFKYEHWNQKSPRDEEGGSASLRVFQSDHEYAFTHVRDRERRTSQEWQLPGKNFSKKISGV